MNASLRRKSKKLSLVLLALFGLPFVLLCARWPGLPTAELLREHVSLTTFPDNVQDKVAHVMFVPMAAVLVVFFRLTLGVRVLGPFRSILLAVAFQVTGVFLGLVFLIGATITVVALSTPIKALRMPYYGRITVVMSTVAVLMVLGVLSSNWLDVSSLQTIAYFPIVVLCLVADAIRRTIRKEGIGSAVWRGSATGVVAVLLVFLSQIPWLRQALLMCPELMIVQIGAIVVISKFFAWRLVQNWLATKFGKNHGDESDENEDDDDEQPTVATAANTSAARNRKRHLLAAAQPITAPAESVGSDSRA